MSYSPGAPSMSGSCARDDPGSGIRVTNPLAACVGQRWEPVTYPIMPLSAPMGSSGIQTVQHLVPVT